MPRQPLVIAPDPIFTETSVVPQLPVLLRQETKRKRATAQIRGTAIEIVIPKHWRKEYQKSVARELAQKIQHRFSRDFKLLQGIADPLITIKDKKELETWVHTLNAKTLLVPVKGIRIGYSRYTQLAQMNLRTHVMTVSKYCLTRVPESALRYLVLHELAHLKVPNHSAAFWAEIKPFMPDYKQQRHLISAVHRIRLYEDELFKAAGTTLKKAVEGPPKMESSLKQLLLNLFIPQER
jgi:hypothetical protein